MFKKLAVVWWMIKHYKAFVKVYDEGKGILLKVKGACREESEDGKNISKNEYMDIIDKVKEFVDSLKLGG